MEKIDSGFHAHALKEAAQPAQPGLGPEQMVHEYDKFSKNGRYNEVCSDTYFKGPAVVAAAVVKYANTNREMSVLDVAAGTGQVGVKLREFGFYDIDALDPSKGMLDAARKQNIYKQYLNIYFNGTGATKNIKSSTYDVLVCSGGMNEGHLKCDSLKEMVRCVKKGGFVINAMREEFLWTVEEYRDRLEPYMKQLEVDGQWVRLEKTRVPGFFHKKDGILYVFQVTKTSD